MAGLNNSVNDTPAGSLAHGGRCHNSTLLIVGRTASGKDYVASLLEKRYGMARLRSYATRPPRFEGEDTHVFIDDADVPDKVAVTRIGPYEYFATRQQVLASDIYVIDPRGVDSLIESMPDGRFIIAYIHANDSLRERAFLSRDASATHETFVARECAESPEFDEFERRLSTSDLPPCVCCAIFFTNGYTAMNAESIAKTLAVVTGRSSFVDNDI